MVDVKATPQFDLNTGGLGANATASLTSNFSVNGTFSYGSVDNSITAGFGGTYTLPSFVQLSASGLATYDLSTNSFTSGSLTAGVSNGLTLPNVNLGYTEGAQFTDLAPLA